MSLFRILPMVALLLTPTTLLAAVLEVPAKDAELSGVLFTAGWKCPPFGKITVVFDDLPPLEAATGLPRGDTKGACGNDGNNGWLAQFNYNILQEAAAAAETQADPPDLLASRGMHTARALDDGVEFARATFYVTSLGARFLRGATGEYELEGFPEEDESVTVSWTQGVQNFLITDQATVVPGDLSSLIGTWDFVFRIISTFTQRYRLQEVRDVSGTQGLVGLDERDDLVLVMRSDDLSLGGSFPFEFAMLDPGTIICDFFVFNRTGVTSISGSYFLVDVDSSGDCVFRSPTTGGSPTERDLTGVRVSASASSLTQPLSYGVPAEVQVAREELMVLEEALVDVEAQGRPLTAGGQSAQPIFEALEELRKSVSR